MGQTSENGSGIKVLHWILDSRFGGARRLAQTTARQLRDYGVQTRFLLGQRSRNGWQPDGFEVFGCRDLHCLNVYLVLLLLILFSFYNHFLVANQIYLQVLFGFLFFRYNVVSPPAFRGAGARTT